MLCTFVGCGGKEHLLLYCVPTACLVRCFTCVISFNLAYTVVVIPILQILGNRALGMVADQLYNVLELGFKQRSDSKARALLILPVFRVAEVDP